MADATTLDDRLDRIDAVILKAHAEMRGREPVTQDAEVIERWRRDRIRIDAAHLLMRLRAVHGQPPADVVMTRADVRAAVPAPEFSGRPLPGAAARPVSRPAADEMPPEGPGRGAAETGFASAALRPSSRAAAPRRVAADVPSRPAARPAPRPAPTSVAASSPAALIDPAETAPAKPARVKRAAAPAMPAVRLADVARADVARAGAALAGVAAGTAEGLAAAAEQLAGPAAPAAVVVAEPDAPTGDEPRALPTDDESPNDAADMAGAAGEAADVGDQTLPEAGDGNEPEAGDPNVGPDGWCFVAGQRLPLPLGKAAAVAAILAGYEISKADLFSLKRARHIVRARQELMYALYQFGGWGYSPIAHWFSAAGRYAAFNHTTIMHGASSHAERLGLALRPSPASGGAKRVRIVQHGAGRWGGALCPTCGRPLCAEAEAGAITATAFAPDGAR